MELEPIKRKCGRPVTFYPAKKQEAVNAILSRVATSRDSILTICKSDKDLPNAETFFTWIRESEELAHDYARAKESQADIIAEEMLDISDNGTNDYMERQAGNGDNVGWQLNGEHVQRSKLRIETRKWLLGKLRPKRYGDTVRQEITGANGGALNVTVTPIQASIL